MISANELSRAQIDIFSAIHSARKMQKRTAIFTKRFAGKSSALFTYVIDAFEQRLDNVAVIFVPSEPLVESYVLLKKNQNYFGILRITIYYT